MIKELKILLADNDIDDRFFFDKIIKAIPIKINLSMLEDGAVLMNYLIKNKTNLPDVVFLDLNMPLKNGTECLTEIKEHEALKHLPVIIYSTSLHSDIVDILYAKGAHYYIHKGGLDQLQKNLHDIFTLIEKNKFVRPIRTQFIFSHDNLIV